MCPQFTNPMSLDMWDTDETLYFGKQKKGAFTRNCKKDELGPIYSLKIDYRSL